MNQVYLSASNPAASHSNICFFISLNLFLLANSCFAYPRIIRWTTSSHLHAFFSRTQYMGSTRHVLQEGYLYKAAPGYH
ncbi:hypothetical protein HDV64DRAFT_50219 [Trichoderma sp. TUCIM 5745]